MMFYVYIISVVRLFAHFDSVGQVHPVGEA